MKGRRSRGQVLIIAVFGIAIVLLSTQAYIFTVKKSEISSGYSYLSDYVLGIKLGSGHVVASSLINVSRGGAASNFANNLEKWESFVAGDYRFGRCDLNGTLSSQTSYSQGIWLDWGTDGVGMSSAYSAFVLNLSGKGVEAESNFEVNVTTSVFLSGNYAALGGDSKAVTVYVNLLNEGAPALHNSTTLTYLSSGIWSDPSVLGDYSAFDFGNGTYRYTFTDVIPGNQVPVRALIYDKRGIFVQAEVPLAEG